LKFSTQCISLNTDKKCSDSLGFTASYQKGLVGSKDLSIN